MISIIVIVIGVLLVHTNAKETPSQWCAAQLAALNSTEKLIKNNTEELMDLYFEHKLQLSLGNNNTVVNCLLSFISLSANEKFVDIIIYMHSILYLIYNNIMKRSQ